MVVMTALLAAAPQDEVTLGPEHQKALETCDPVRLVGTFGFDFRVLPSGKVADLTIHISELPKEAEACVVAKIRSWVFPKRKRAGRVADAFVFKGSPRFAQPFIGHAVLDKFVFKTLDIPVAQHAECKGRTCMIQMETALMCAAFSEGHQRLAAGARWGEVVGPIADTAASVCCDDMVGVLMMLESMPGPRFQEWLWCGIAKDDLLPDAGRGACGWAACEGFNRFWSAYNRQPEDWFPPVKDETKKAPPPATPPKTDQL